MQNLIFFDKEGNPLNFFYNEGLERYEGDILFPENSEDTFKTQALYLFEKIPAFEYENQEHLTLRRFQLFNEYGFHFYQGVATQSITKIEPVNQESTYYSKWIYGKNIEATYPLGTFIRFNTPIFEFTDLNRTYCVISSKKGAIMIISLMDNSTFDSNYNGFYGLTSSYEGVSISGVDIIGIYNYITPDLRDTLSLWNEPTFYDRIYQYRKLNIVNTSKNDNYSRTNRFDDVGVVTIKNANLFDAIPDVTTVSGGSIKDGRAFDKNGNAYSGKMIIQKQNLPSEIFSAIGPLSKGVKEFEVTFENGTPVRFVNPKTGVIDRRGMYNYQLKYNTEPRKGEQLEFYNRPKTTPATSASTKQAPKASPKGSSGINWNKK
jgi:hypothetical protein